LFQKLRDDLEGMGLGGDGDDEDRP
jgi:hypothetical protein